MFWNRKKQSELHGHHVKYSLATAEENSDMIFNEYERLIKKNEKELDNLKENLKNLETIEISLSKNELGKLIDNLEKIVSSEKYKDDDERRTSFYGYFDSYRSYKVFSIKHKKLNILFKKIFVEERNESIETIKNEIEDIKNKIESIENECEEFKKYFVR